ncbi:Uncharacterized membrane protein [Devosia enhydra]|uniref:Uncharacterized membrane protein n=1 Tax=Devosia enhydra TaxID=665118 RepID=A0A1K2I2U0_9HYPH|nr:heparan-alpha-glucosaminide N-acetyltransferase [Devosia enhydra]SFZ86640.1 Uncharacterized membrane protein [Devosia enhydra]
MPSETPKRRPRILALDAVRGLAIILMVVFHLFWDLSYLGFYGVDVTTDPAWVGFQRVILSSFMALVGIGLVLGHGEGIRWRAFWRRFGFVAGAALLVTAGTFWLFPQTFVYFGVLHAIALFSLLGLAFLFLPLWLVIGLGLAMPVASALYHDPIFTERALSWIGFWPVSPPVNDLVPVFPWFGVVLLGIALTRIGKAKGLFERLAIWKPGRLGRGLALLGRWSLLIYLLHQPLLLGGLVPLSQALDPGAQQRAATFLSSCETACLNTGGGETYCVAYCSCALDQIASGDLWDVIEAEIRTPDQEAEVGALTRLCSAMATPQ